MGRALPLEGKGRENGKVLNGTEAVPGTCLPPSAAQPPAARAGTAALGSEPPGDAGCACHRPAPPGRDPRAGQGERGRGRRSGGPRPLLAAGGGVCRPRSPRGFGGERAAGGFGGLVCAGLAVAAFLPPLFVPQGDGKGTGGSVLGVMLCHLC